ncbi:imidazoleglycerol-phosphate dehydratase HisB [Akkermansiaceae bacterium]|nr:imidazoleglycerol-phosphate dehydratase HisB [Akkermansiaceae bacterium]MDB4435930.1 imidazoleglycerol-phosphate dehydratase HisB [Akkermansiaceae bacterium]MDB4500576.1 imidazoleglycerol-phosphate dehydratase HisB [Akkermansiaceae bacterium]MDB4507992.1 imidazoleglycerol-phosphate dehydratase HisB [Akkermansiaceae bacterium]MDB4541367.1 imidazoleglycerol-phosphate dehydratase HisB [Akkermansiaceae bacterium]
MSERSASQNRDTAETKIKLSLDLDGEGKSNINTGVPFFDHMLTLFSRHSAIDLNVEVDGDIEVDYHHTVEDTGIVLGECLREALGDKSGIRRYGHAYIPMDETLSRTVIDLSNRPHLEFITPADTPSAQNFPFTYVEEFVRAVTANLRANIHIELLYGRDGHHIAESIFKSLARAIRVAIEKDPRQVGIPSTKEVL